MSNRRTFLAASTLTLTGVLAGGGALAAARGSTPTASAPITVNEVAPGVTAELFASSPSAWAGGQSVHLARFVFQPGMGIFPHGHPGTTLLGIESGTFGWTLVEGVAHVVRGAGGGGTGPGEEITEPGVELLLDPGDAIYDEADVIHTARGAGDEPAVVMATLVLTTGAPLLMTPEQMAEMG